MVRPWTSPRRNSNRRNTASSTRATAGSSSTPRRCAGASRRPRPLDELRGDVLFDRLGVGIDVLGPNEPMSMYHWESDQENFVVLSGSALLIVEGQERQLRPWDFVHCPPYTEHTIVGGPEGCVVLGVGSRERHTELGPDGERRGKEGESEYTVDEAAIRHGAGIEPGTPQDEAYARFPPGRFVRYDGWLEWRR